MAGNSTVVETVFTLVDQASAKVEKLSSDFIGLQKQAMAAKAEVAKAAETPHAVAAKGAVPHGEATFENSLQEGGFNAEQRAAMKAERRLERERQWAAREAAEKHTIGGRIVLASAQMFGLSMQGTAGKIVQMGSMVGQIGIELSQFSGKVGMLGGVMAKAGGVLSALSAGWAAGSWLDEKLGLSDKLAGVSSPAQTKSANNAWARSMGYRSAAEYEAARHTQRSSAQQVKLEVAAKKYGADLGALPVNATAAEMNAYNKRLREAGVKVLRESGVPAAQMGDVMREVAEQAKNGLPAQQLAAQEKMEQDLRMSAAVKKQAQLVGTLPTNATRAEMEAFNVRLLKSGTTILASGEMFGASLDDILGMLREQAGDSLASMSASLRDRTGKELEAGDKEETALKQLNKMQLGRSVESRKAYNEALLMQATRIAGEVYGNEEAGRHVEEIYRDLRTRTKLDKTSASFDFRGSKFDIKQNFAEGIEPGDVSVALTNDIAALAERQLTSGFSPIFGGI